MMIVAAIRSLIGRFFLCTQNDHRDTLDATFGVLEWRCMDCGRCTLLGIVQPFASNRRVRP